MNGEDYTSVLETLNIAGSTASLFSLLLTALIYIGIRKIRRFYIYIARVPELNEKLENSATEMSEHLDQFKGNSTKTHEILMKAEVSLKSLSLKINNNEIKSKIKDTLDEISSLEFKKGFFGKKEKNLSTEDQKKALESIYLGLRKITFQCRENYEQSRWENGA